MYPELWLHDLARERQREMRKLATRSARRGSGEEHLTRDPRPRKSRKGHLYVVHAVRLFGNWARPHIAPDTRARE